ncbi:hypothetical protein ASPZODRAFT_134567 [Penicilliopsis zonata CBS 506.65]|uniref:Alpha/beta hydrolase fold-3 domain-containing protein n=1 Tax=Penicilliopsis zonata CBS 506.65 TaxID=1073090 RepID=A0A1L9SDE1_9EURO|nr:hypothetical protein ASPZODRAFT_134567 [Penicilliopsis zonata CBS 506.65]OJJ45158.1 hypothetical protein ASPZODRAFT_134567 [Penicilliopsis zonata CBS 506.65]
MDLRLVSPDIDPAIVQAMDPEFVRYFIETIQHLTPTHTVPLAECRAHPERFVTPWIYDSSGEPRVSDHTVTSADGFPVPVRVYTPDPDVFGPGPYGVHVNFHGGGFVFGSLQADALFCLKVRDRAGLVVVDVNYRHCPEAVFGKGIEDAWAALQWTHQSNEININPSSISIGGISAGGFLCCVVQHLARDAGLPLRLCVPAVPVTTDSCSYTSLDDSPYPSFREYSRAPLLNWKRMSFFQKHVFPANQMDRLRASLPDWWLSPMRAPDSTGLCDTFLITAECDPMRDEGEAYGVKLVQAGNKVTMKRYLGVPHPFMHMAKVLQKARDYDEDVLNALTVAHQGSI